MRQVAHIVDGTWLAVASYYSTPQADGLRDRSGHPTNALYGMLQYLSNQQDEETPDYLHVVFDPETRMSGWRKRLYREYKANRKPHPNDLTYQRNEAPTLCKAVGLPVHVARPGDEADDLVATLCHHYTHAGVDCVIHSVDSDFWQLIQGPNGGINDPRGAVYMWDRLHRCLWTPESVQAKTGVPPHLIADWKALGGCKADNIPGVTGVGPVSAAMMLRRHGSLDHLKVALLQQGNVVSSRERAVLQCRNLRVFAKITRLHNNCPLDTMMLDIREPASLKGVLFTFKEYGFDKGPSLDDSCTLRKEA